MKRLAITAAFALVAAAILTAGTAGATPREEAHELYWRHHTEQLTRGITPPWWDLSLEAVAQERANYMAATGEFTHYPSNGRDFRHITAEWGWGPWWVGENIGLSHAGESMETMNAVFMNSPSHRALILHGGFTRVAIAIAYGPNDMKYTAVIFAGRW